MVHNGIEYGDEELIDESYNVMRNVLGLSVDEMADIFAEWNKGELDSYLVEITADILTRKDDLGADKSKPIVDMILDRGANKGTGKWSSETAPGRWCSTIRDYGSRLRSLHLHDEARTGCCKQGITSRC